jgi:predicted nucleic acid-binding protein
MMVFLDTSVLLAGMVDFGPQSAPARSIFHAAAERKIESPGTAWHCCLEFYSVATRLLPEFRLTPDDAWVLLREEVFSRLSVSDLPPDERAALFAASARDRIAGGRIYDAHIAEVARCAGAKAIVTDNRRHFLAALRHGIKVETPAEFLAAMRSKRG